MRDLVKALRQRKDNEEISHIRTAAKRAEQAFRKLSGFIKPAPRNGTRHETRISDEEQGARKPAFDTIVASGANGAMPHAAATSAALKRMS